MCFQFTNILQKLKAERRLISKLNRIKENQVEIRDGDNLFH